MLIGLEGQTSSGKSTFAYTGPLPLVGFAFDAGARRSLYGSMHEKLFKDIDIEIVQWPPPVLLDVADLLKHWCRSNGRAITVYLLPQPLPAQKAAAKLWNEFTKLSNIAIHEEVIATTVFDTMTIARRVAADTHLEALQAADPSRKQLLQHEWGVPGNWIRAIYTQCQNESEVSSELGKSKHFVFTHHLTERRLNEKVITDAGGNPIWDMEGLHNTYRFLDIAMRFEKELQDVVLPGPDPLTPGKKTKQVGVTAQFTKNGLDISMEGTSVKNPTWDSLARLLNKTLGKEMQIELRDSE